MHEAHPLVTVGREARAMVTQALLLASYRDTHAAIREAERVVVLVHGFMAGAAVLEPLAEHLRRTLGLPVVSYGYGSHLGFDRIVADFASFLERRVPRGARLALVGHSLGGLVCRAYAQEHEDAARVDRLVTLACPHRGTRIAHLVPTELGRALRPASPSVRRLDASSHRLAALAPTWIVAERDHVVPQRGDEPALQGARRHVVVGVGHNGILYDARAHRLVEESLRRAT